MRPSRAGAFAIVTLLIASITPVAARAHTPRLINESVPRGALARLNEIAVNSLSVNMAKGQSHLKSIEGDKGAALTPPNQLVYIGAEYCPFCAATRWPLVIALLRFGHIAGLRYMVSGSHERYSNIRTFSFRQARYESRYIKFHGIEVQDRNHKQLERLTHSEKELLIHFDRPPFAKGVDAVPFVDIGTRYVGIGSSVSPKLLSGLSWAQIFAKLRQPQSSLYSAVITAANQYTAAICTITDGQPRRVCAMPAVTNDIKALER